MTTARKHPPKVRTLGLPDTPERARMTEAYELYDKAQQLATNAHNAWRRIRREHDANDAHRQVKAALTRATKAALRLADAKAQYQLARAAAQAAA